MLVSAVAAGAQDLPVAVTTDTAQIAGTQVMVDVYRPVAESVGVAVLAHGFSRERSRNRDLGRALAYAGVSAVAPDLPHAGEVAGSVEVIAGVVRAIETGAFGLPPTRRSHIVLLGTSAGGLGTVIAASQLPGLAGWVGLDPVEQGGLGMIAAGKLTVPAVVLLGDPSLCNLFGSGRWIANAVPAPVLVRSERMRGASHCDFEGPTNNFCRVVCGRSAPGMAEAVRGEAVRTTLEMLGRAREEQLPKAMVPSLEQDRVTVGGRALSR